MPSLVSIHGTHEERAKSTSTCSSQATWLAMASMPTISANANARPNAKRTLKRSSCEAATRSSSHVAASANVDHRDDARDGGHDEARAPATPKSVATSRRVHLGQR